MEKFKKLFESNITESFTKDVFIKHINKLRTQNKGSWYTFTGVVDGKEVQLKGTDTWLQIYKVDGIDYSNPMQRKVKDFKEDLLKPFE